MMVLLSLLLFSLSSSFLSLLRLLIDFFLTVRVSVGRDGAGGSYCYYYCKTLFAPAP